MKICKLAAAATLATLTTVTSQSLTANAQVSNIFHATLVEQGAKTPEVSTEQVRRILLDGSAPLIDTRSVAEFEAGHIPGAAVLDVPSAEQIAAVSRMVGGDKAKAVVLYCNGPFCQASRRLAEQLADAGFSNVRRYQLGIPVWRALGGPTVIELEGIKRVYRRDQTAVFIDARSPSEFAVGSLSGARNAPVDKVLSGELKKIDLPEDDFNRRIVLFGHNGAQGRQLADFMGKRPWHNVSYFPGTYAELIAGIGSTN